MEWNIEVILQAWKAKCRDYHNYYVNIGHSIITNGFNGKKAFKYPILLYFSMVMRWEILEKHVSK